MVLGLWNVPEGYLTWLLAAATRNDTANSESEVPEEDFDVKETEEIAPVSESNGGDSAGLKQEADQDEIGRESSLSTFSYDQLKAKSDNPITGIDFKRREVGILLLLNHKLMF